MRRSSVARNTPVGGALSALGNHPLSRVFSRGAAGLACSGALIVLTSCLASNPSSGSGSGQLAVSPNNGSLQSAVVGAAFGAPLVAVATRGGNPTSGVAVTFTAPSSGASGTFANGTATETDTSDSNGLATSSTFTANTTAGGPYNVTATASGATGPANFSLTNLAAAQLTISATNGSPQNALVSTEFALPFSVVVDQNAKPVSGVTVVFTAPSSGAGGTFAKTGTATESDTTDANGSATSSAFTANSTAGGPYFVAANVSGASKEADFSLTNSPISALTINPNNGSPQTALVNAAFAAPLVAVVNLDGVQQGGVSVTFTAPATGASGAFAGPAATDTVTTDASGLATSSVFTANSAVGTYVVTASILGVTKPANFSLTNAIPVITTVSGTPQSAAVSTAFAMPFAAQVLYSNNSQPVSGASVTFTAPGSGASGTFPGGGTTETKSTDSSGNVTSSTFTANASAGSYTVAATVPGASAAANFSLTNTSSNVGGVFATGGVAQNAAVSSAFKSVLVASVVDNGGSLLSGVSVTFTAPGSGASGAFSSNHTSTETVVSDSSGHATSSTFTANGTSGTYTVTATAGSSTGNFLLTNTSAAVTSYAFYMSGQSLPHPTGTTNYYALAGAIIVDQATGAVLGGEEDYNDANGYTYAQVPITGGSFSVSTTTGQGTLTLSAPSQTTLGNSGTETFGVQFVNSNHALIMQFDGSATSSGSLDLQNLSTPPSGGYAFTMSGTDPAYAPLAMGGVFAFNGNLLSPSWPGTYDLNDGTVGVSTGNGFTASVSAVDLYGRGQITGIAYFTQTFTLNYYQVGPEALRIIDMDTNIAAVGSAFGQGANATNASNAGLGTSVFGVGGNPTPLINSFGALGQFATDGAGHLTSGVGDEKELGTNFLIDVDLGSSGTYQVGINGYGTLTLPSGVLGNVSSFALYLTDPNLNLNDPNNTTGGGGALLLDLDTALSGGTGLVTPQTDTSVSSFNGNYAVSWQNLNEFYCANCEFDIVAQGSITAASPSSLNLLGRVSDPFGTFSTNPIETSGVAFSSNPDTDGSHPGRYTMLGKNNPPNLLSVTIPNPVAFRDFNVVVYQASGAQLFWLDVDNNGANFDAVFLGAVEQQGSLSGIPAVRSGRGRVRTADQNLLKKTPPSGQK